jgi:asparagine synthetase A
MRGGGALRTALDLSEFGITVMRQNLRRQFPDASAEDIDRRLCAWVQHRPGAEHGDAAGRAVDPRIRFG